MEKSYYQQLLDRIEELFISKSYKEASKLVDNELSMPYVPREFEEKLLKYRDDLKGYLTEEKPEVLLSKEQVRDYLMKGSRERIAQVIGFLASANIRNYLETVEDYLLSDFADPLTSTQILQIMRDQQLSRNIQLKKNGIILQADPSKLPDVLEQPVLQDVFRDIEELFETDDPVFMQQCQSVLLNFAFNLYPVLLNDEDREKVLYSVIRYVYCAYDDHEGWKQFCSDHQIEEKGLIKFEL
ncbi:MAG: DUF3196 family protein [Erysipelotrichaceae bacterium]|nr:DUF3196 family protein [Erysipelotrichaceae bacterium]